MKSINFDTGVKEYAINGDENNTVKINVSDMNIIKRFEEARGKLDDIVTIIKSEEPVPELLAKADSEARELLDHVFNTDISAHLFGTVNVLSPVAGGKTLFESALAAVLPVIMADIEAAAQAAKIRIDSLENDKTRKYTEHTVAVPQISAKPFIPYADPQASQKAAAIDISAMSQEEKNALLRQLMS